MTRTAALCTILLLTLAACNRSAPQDGDELLQQQQDAAKQAGQKQAQDIIAASMNDSSTAEIAQLQADVEALKGSQQGKQYDAVQQQLDDQRAQILALQAEVDDLKSGRTGTPSSATGKSEAGTAPSRRPATARPPVSPPSRKHPDADAKH